MDRTLATSLKAALRAVIPPAIVGLVLAACALHVGLQGKVESDLQRFMPLDGMTTPAGLAELAEAGAADRLVLAAIEGGAEPQRIAASRSLVDALVGTDGLARVRNSAEPPSPDGLATLLPYRYLLGPDIQPQRFEREALEAAFRQRLRDLSSPFGGVERRRVVADPTDEIGRIVAAWEPAESPREERGVWVSRDGQRAVLLLELAFPAGHLDKHEVVLASVRAAFAEVGGDAGMNLRLTGAPVFALDARDTVRAEIQRLSIAATLLLLLLLLWFYRSLVVFLLVGVPLLGAILVGTSVVMAVFGAVHGIVLAFGCTLVGVAMDYPVHLVSHRRSGEQVAASVKRIWPTLRLGVISTVLGYSAMVLADIPGLAQLGVFAASGLLAAAAITRYLLPRLIPRELPVLRLSEWPWLDRAPPAHGRWLVLVGALLSLALLWFWPNGAWEEDLGVLNPVPVEQRALDSLLRDDLAASDVRHLALIRGDDAEQVLQRSEHLADAMQSLRERDVLRALDHPAMYLASIETQRRRQSILPMRDVLERDVESAAAAVGFSPGAFQPFIEDVSKARILEPLTPGDLLQTSLAGHLHAYLLETSDGWVGLVRFHGVRDPAALAEWFAHQDPAGVLYLDNRSRMEEVLTTFRESALWRSLAGAVLILLALTIGLRSPWQALRVASPPLAAAIVTSAILVVAGQPLSVFHLVSLLLVVGLGLDYALFFNRRPDGEWEQSLTRRALLVCALSTLSVFCLLAVSSLTVLEQIGRTVALGVMLALLFAWLLSNPRKVWH